MREVKGYLMIATAAIFWGCSATAAKFLLNQHVGTVLIVQTRVSFSALLLLVLYLVFKRWLLRVRASDLWRFALLGVVGVAGSNFTYYFAIKESTVATAIVLQYAAPILVMGYAALSGEERLTALKLTAATVSLSGCFLAVGAYNTSSLGITSAGLMSGIGSMVSFAFLSIYTRHVLRRYNVWTTTFYAIAFASLFWLVVNPPSHIIAQSPSPGTWGGLLVLAVISILIPHSLYFAGLQHVVASRAVITSTLEPVVAMVSAVVFLGEFLEPVQTIGGGMVLGAVLLLQTRKEEETAVPTASERDADVA